MDGGEAAIDLHWGRCSLVIDGWNRCLGDAAKQVSDSSVPKRGWGSPDRKVVIGGEKLFGGGLCVRCPGLTKVPLKFANPLNGAIGSFLVAGHTDWFPDIEPALYMGCLGRGKIEVQIGGCLAQKQVQIACQYLVPFGM